MWKLGLGNVLFDSALIALGSRAVETSYQVIRIRVNQHWIRFSENAQEAPEIIIKEWPKVSAVVGHRQLKKRVD